MGIVPPATDAAEREAELRTWVERELGSVVRWTPLDPDASFRRYFRVAASGHDALLAVDAPPAREPMHAWLDVGRHFAQAHVHVPAVIAHDADAGFALIEDLGETLYLDALSAGSAEKLYTDAIDALVAIQSLPRGNLPAYTADELRMEMDLFVHWYLREHLGVPHSAIDNSPWEAICAMLIDSAQAQPQVVVHRDYHARNLLVADPNPGIIDYQDALWGPVTYDLVSLLCDCYIAWPRAQVLGWIGQWQNAAEAAEVASGIPRTELLRMFDYMGLQRHLKACGIFARLKHRDGRDGYLKDIPRTLTYMHATCARYPELAACAVWLENVAPIPAAD